MNKEWIRDKGLWKAPSYLDEIVINFAREQIRESNDDQDELYRILEWLPFSELILLIRAVLQNSRISVRPTIY
ncbi:MAG: hypothetical protein JW784_07325 [Candidatus Cloacimonetes bacterium]|nr:hypothetical protein [Candidatus Cloacimonadota bacterium]